MSVQTSDQKKDEFRKYLEKSGVVDQLTKVLVGLYEEGEKPATPVDFIKKCLGAPADSELEALAESNAALKDQRAQLHKRIEALRGELEAEKAKQM